ncbi:MAG: hypothetical protein OHK0022_45140 [Roseiflexaceae bacterium]
MQQPNHVRRAYDLARLGFYDRALEEVQRALEQNPRSAEAHVQGAWVLRRQRKPEAAIESARAALALEPAYASAHYVLALALWDAGRLDEAEAAFRDALAQPHHDRDTHLTEYARLLSALKRSAEALPLLEEAQRLSPNLATVAEVRGINLVELGRTEEARAAFREALRLNPHNVKALNYLGWLDLRAARGDEALEHFRAALALAPTDSYARAKLPEALRLRLPVYGHARRLWARLRPSVKRQERWLWVGLLAVLLCSPLIRMFDPDFTSLAARLWSGLWLGLGATVLLRLLWAITSAPLLNTLLLLDPLGRTSRDYDPAEGIVLGSALLSLLGLALWLAVLALAGRTWLAGVGLLLAVFGGGNMLLAHLVLRVRSRPRTRQTWLGYGLVVGSMVGATLLNATPLAPMSFLVGLFIALALIGMVLAR